MISPVKSFSSDASVGRSVSIVTTAATETVVDTFAESTEQAAHTGANQEDSNPSQYEPNPDVGSTLTIQTQDSGVLVTVGHVLHAVVIQHADFSPEGSKEAINLIFGILKSFIDVIFSVEEFSGGYKGTMYVLINQNDSRHTNLFFQKPTQPDRRRTGGKWRLSSLSNILKTIKTGIPFQQKLLSYVRNNNSCPPPCPSFLRLLLAVAALSFKTHVMRDDVNY